MHLIKERNTVCGYPKKETDIDVVPAFLKIGMSLVL